MTHIKLLLLIAFSMLIMGDDLPYWADKKGRTPTATCNQYELARTNTDISISTSFSYVDCFGISRTVEIEAPEFGYRTVAYICSSVAPTLVQFPGSPLPPQATATFQKCCGCPDPEDPEKPEDPEAPEVECGSPASYGGGKTYPGRFLVDLGTGEGTVTVEYNAFNIPDKFLIINPNAVVPMAPVVAHSNGYKGSTDYQSAICSFYKSIGYGCPSCRGEFTTPWSNCDISGHGAGSFSFSKSSSLRWVYVEVYAPLSGTGWEVTVGCPVP